MKKFKTLSTLFLPILSIATILLFFTGCGKEPKIEAEKEKAPVTEMKKPGVEEIREFHGVLFPVWHTYLPERDFKSIREAVPEFKRTLEILMKAELPQFYHNVKDDFEDKRESLTLAVENLDSVAQTGDDEKLAKAVEDMHTAFEKMVRVLAPRIKELEDFHLVLYPLWHQAMPKKDFRAIKASIPSLKERIDALMKAQLPQKLKDVEIQFIERRETLRKEVLELADVCRQNKDHKIIEKLTQMHEAYLKLDEVFE